MTRDEWRLLGYGVMTAALMGLVLVPILLHNRNFPRLAAEGILGAVAFAVFGFSKYMERRKKPN
jgi:putative effector of murein hydrolase